MYIFSHRGIGFNEPENSVPAFKKALLTGFGLEIDVRLNSSNQVMVSHDLPANLAVSLDEILPILRDCENNQIIIAVHLKEDKDELWHPVCQKLKNVLSVFLFDTTIESAQKIKKEFPQIKLGFSVGESHFSPTIYLLDEVLNLPECDIIWWDEWTEFGKVYNEYGLKKIRKSNKKVYAVSPELHRFTIPSHRYAKNPSEVWRSLIEMGVDGICTDLPTELRGFVNKFYK